MSIVAIGELFPLVWLFDFSLAKSGDLFASNVLIWPNPPQWQNYATAIKDGNMVQFFINSVLVNSITVAATVVISLMAAYACTRMRWKLNRTVMNILLLGMMIPIYATLLPNYIIYNALSITDTIWGLLIPYIAFSLPQGIFIMSGFLDGVPHELEESAVIDGCGIFRIIFRIVFPLVKPAIVTIAIMTFLNNWNEFVMAMTYLSSNTWKTLPFSVINFTGQYYSNYAVQFAVMALSALPALIVFILLNKQITKGITIGAVKG
jgi:raffinose/stachyose/melibiose transport system permease protein